MYFFILYTYNIFYKIKGDYVMNLIKTIISCLIFILFCILFLKFGAHILNFLLLLSLLILTLDVIYLKYIRN